MQHRCWQKRDESRLAFILGSLGALCMIRILALAALTTASLAIPAMAQQSAAPQEVQLNPQQQEAVRCSAAFAIVAGLQSAGGGKQWPPLAQRGKEYFVRVSAQLMDETGLTQEQVGALMKAEAQKLVQDPDFEKVVPPCLTMLNASGL